MYNALQEEYRWMNTGAWAEEDEKNCPCHGSGWCLSDLDTWHSCPVHNTGQMHPKKRDIYMDALEEHRRAMQEDSVFITDIVVVGEPLKKAPQQEPDDCPF